ncbi:response regulator [bacterium]|nr:response regulator [bacterium]
MSSNSLSELKDNVRILLAEDVYINQKVIVSFLNKLGFKNIRVVDNGQQCIDALDDDTFDILLLDIRMPIVSGTSVVKHVRERFTNKRRPYMIAVTAYCMLEDKQRYLDMGFDGFLLKPVNFYELGKCMDNFTNLLLKG